MFKMIHTPWKENIKKEYLIQIKRNSVKQLKK